MSAPIFARALLLPCRETPSLDTIEDALLTAVLPAGDWRMLRRLPPVRPGWFLGDEALVYRWAPTLGDPSAVSHPPVTVVIDAPDRPLPPEPLDGSADQEALVAAHALGAFGPGAQPGCLVRAAGSTPEWPGAATVAAEHRGLIRVRITYALGGGGTPSPAGRSQPLELSLLTSLGTPLLELPGVLAWFHAPGERLMSRAGVRRARAHAREDQRLPVELWTHLRAWSLDDADGWMIYDTVGMATLGARDLEVAARSELLSPTDAAVFVRNLSLYTLAESDPFKSGHTAESPVGRIRAKARSRGFAAPARRVVRWAPIGGRPLPSSLQS